MSATQRKVTRPRRVLMIAAAFPPTGGSGVQRSVKFAKYLPSCGWVPTVWTMDRLDGLPTDATLLTGLPAEVMIHRCRSSRRPPAGRAFTFQRSTMSTRHDPVQPGWFLMKTAKNLARAVIHTPAMIRGNGSWLLRRNWPDDCAGWAHRSLAPLRHLVDSQRFDVIYSTFSPASNHLLALKLSEETSLPWVADFRDLWTDDFRYRQGSRRRRRADRRLEQEILEKAGTVIAATDRQTEILASHVPASEHKFVTITNGFDPDDFPRLHEPGGDRGEEPGATAVPAVQVPPLRMGVHCSQSRARPFQMAYVGRMDRWCAREAWFEGLTRFADGLGSHRGAVLLSVTGHADQTTVARIRATGIPYLINGYVSHQRAVQEMVSADVLVLLAPEGHNAESVICAKVFEYLAAGRPILAVGPNGSEPTSGNECHKIVSSCDAGLTVPFDAWAIADALGRLHSRWRAGLPLPGCPRSRLSPYSRVTQTGLLAAVFNRLVGDDERLPVWVHPTSQPDATAVAAVQVPPLQMGVHGSQSSGTPFPCRGAVSP